MPKAGTTFALSSQTWSNGVLVNEEKIIDGMTEDQGVRIMVGEVLRVLFNTKKIDKHITVCRANKTSGCECNCLKIDVSSDRSDGVTWYQWKSPDGGIKVFLTNECT